MNIKVKGFFCTSSHIVSHTHIAPCVRYLSSQHLVVGKDGKNIESIKNTDLQYIDIICHIKAILFNGIYSTNVCLIHLDLAVQVSIYIQVDGSNLNTFLTVQASQYADMYCMALQLDCITLHKGFYFSGYFELIN